MSKPETNGDKQGNTIMKYKITVEYTGHKTFILDTNHFSCEEIGGFFFTPDTLEQHFNPKEDRLNSHIALIELIATNEETA